MSCTLTIDILWDQTGAPTRTIPPRGRQMIQQHIAGRLGRNSKVRHRDDRDGCRHDVGGVGKN